VIWYVSCDVSSQVAPTPPPVSSRGSGDNARNISPGYFGHTRTSAVARRPISRCRPPPPPTSRPPSRRQPLKASGASQSSTVRDRGHGPSPSPSLSSAVQHVASSPSSNNNQPLISHIAAHLAFLLVVVWVNSSKKPKTPSFQVGPG